MRRSRTALTAWPAFADLMTILAVVGLAIAAGLAGVVDDDADVEALLVAARERNTQAEDRIEELEEQLAATRDREVERRLGSFPCLGTQPGSSTEPAPLLRIVVDDAGYRLTRLWPPGANVGGIPRLYEAIAPELMQEGVLEDYAREMHAYGNSDDTYGRPCRFFVELRKGTNTSPTTFALARAVVEQYFLLSNSSEVIRAIMGR